MTSCSYFPFYPPYGVYEELPPSPFEVIDSSEATSRVQELSIEFRYDRHLHLQQAKTFFEFGIKTIQLEFISQDVFEMEDARKLIVDLTEAFLGKVNQDPILGPMLQSYPFRASDLEIYITFESYFGRFVDPYYIQWICLEDGQIDYYLFDTHNNTKRYWHHRHESYETSREIVVYQREAEQKYAETHRPLIDVFSGQRFFPR